LLSAVAAALKWACCMKSDTVHAAAAKLPPQEIQKKSPSGILFVQDRLEGGRAKMLQVHSASIYVCGGIILGFIVV
jgi:hypothetical protein